MNYDSGQYKPMDRTPPPAGDYTFCVSQAVEGISEKGNEKIDLEIEVSIPGRAKPVRVFDWLVNTSDTLEHIKQFCEATGLNFGNNKITAADCKNRTGRARFALGQPKVNGNRYLECKEYYPSQAGDIPSELQPDTQTVTNNTAGNDDLPF